MTARPFAITLGSDRQGRARHLAGIKTAASDLDHAPTRTEIGRAHFRVRLKSAAGQNQGFTLDGPQAAGVAYGKTGYAAVRGRENALSLGFVPDGNVCLSREAKQGAGQQDAFAFGAERASAGEFDLVGSGNPDRTHCPIKLPSHTQVSHPANRLIRAGNQGVGQRRVGLSAGDAVDVMLKILGCIGIDGYIAWIIVIPNQRHQIVDTVIGAAEQAAGKTGIAAA